jgi:hypothetical protein
MYGVLQAMSYQGYQPLSAKDVLFVEGFEQSASLFTADATLRVKDLLAKVATICAQSGSLSAAEMELLFGAGVACEVLRPGNDDWQTGRLQWQFGFVSDVAGAVAPAAPVAIAAPVASAAPAPAVAAPETAASVAEPTAAPEAGFASFADAMDDDFDAPAVGAPETAASLPIDTISNMIVNEEVAAPEVDGPVEDNDEFGLMDAMDAFSMDEPAPAIDESMGDSPWDLGELDDMLMAN